MEISGSKKDAVHTVGHDEMIAEWVPDVEQRHTINRRLAKLTKHRDDG